MDMSVLKSQKLDPPLVHVDVVKCAFDISPDVPALRIGQLGRSVIAARENDWQ
jgi:hypothetical protein